MGKNSHLHHPISVSVLLLIFPPLAWWIMYKNKKYHSWFPTLILFYTVPNALIFIFNLIFLKTPNKSPIAFALVFYLFQIIFSVLAKNRIASHKGLILVSIAFLTIDTFLPLLVYYLGYFNYLQ